MYHKKPVRLTERPPPNILILRTDPGVLDSRVRKTSVSLRKRGYRVTVFGWDRRREYPRMENIEGVQFHRSRIPAPYGSKWLFPLLKLYWLHAIWRILVDRPNVVHATDLETYIPALFGAKLTGSKLVYDMFDPFAEKVPGLPPWLRSAIGRFDNCIMKKADCVIVTGENRLKPLPVAKLKRTEVILNVPPAGYPSRLPRMGEKFTISYAGAIHKVRGIYVIAEATRDMPDVSVVFAGWIPRKEDEEFLKTQNHIRYVGTLPFDKAMELMASSDLVLAYYDPSLGITSQLSTFNKLYEAMAVGRPILLANESSMADVVRQEQCGYAVPYGDPALLRRTFLEIMQNPAEAERRGLNGFKAFQEKYNWEKMEEKLFKLYADLLETGTV